MDRCNMGGKSASIQLKADIRRAGLYISQADLSLRASVLDVDLSGGSHSFVCSCQTVK